MPNLFTFVKSLNLHFEKLQVTLIPNNRSDLEKMGHKLDRIESALKKEGYTVRDVEDPEPVKKSAPVKRSATVRIVEPKDTIIRDELHNPFWIEREEDVGDGPKKKLPRLLSVCPYVFLSLHICMFVLHSLCMFVRMSLSNLN